MLLVSLFCTSKDEHYIIPIGVVKDVGAVRYGISCLGDDFEKAAKAGDIDKCMSIARSLGVAEKHVGRMRYAHYDAPLVGSSTRLSSFGISYMLIEGSGEKIDKLWKKLNR